jgi:hypothetical protein
MVATDFLRDQLRSYSDWQPKDRVGDPPLSELEQRIELPGELGELLLDILIGWPSSRRS